MFGAFSDFLESATQKAKELSDVGLDLVQNSGYLPQLEEGYNVEENEGRVGQQPAAATAALQRDDVRSGSHDAQALAALPEQWENIATYVPPQLQPYAAEWREFLAGVLAEENTYCVPVHVYLEDAATLARLNAICGVHAEGLTKIIEQVEEHSMDPNAMLDILDHFPSAGQVRFHVVPKYVVEDKFWKHLLVRSRVYHQCPSISAVLDAMDLLHKEPRLESASSLRKHGFGSPANAAVLQEIRDKVSARQILSQWFDSKKNAARSELQTALGSLQLLQNLIVKREVSELSDSVRESCKYRKTKVTALLGELQGVSHKLVDTELDVDRGELFLDLVKLNANLHEAMQQYQQLKETDGTSGEGSSALVVDSGLIAAANVALNSSGPGSSREHVSSSPREASSTSPWTNVSKPASNSNSSVSKADPAGETAFTAELPWEDEDE